MHAKPNQSNWVGRVIDGRFTLLQWIGGSARSAVFLTELDGDRPQKAAIKLIPADATDVEALIADWELTSTLTHPHLMRRFHTGRCEIDAIPQFYTVAEYAEESLSGVLVERPLTPSEAGEMLDPVLDVLSYLHRKGFVYGHLKPSNIMVVDDQLKLSWDNLEVAGEFGKHPSTPGVYDAPEGTTERISPAVDVWSLGVTLVEAFTQHPPAFLKSINREPVVPESIPQPFAGIARECLRSNPGLRCAIGDIKARLHPAQSAKVIDTLAETSTPARSGRRVTVLVAAAAVLLAIFAFVLVRSHRVDSSLPTENQPAALTPAPPAQAPAPPDQTPAPQAQSPASLAQAPAPQVQSPAPQVQSPAPQVQTPTPQAHSPVSESQPSRGSVVKGEVADRVQPDILPAASRSIHGQFQLSLRLTVDSNGAVTNATFDSPGPSKYFARVALEAAQKWRFKPAQVDGQPAPSVWILRFRFTQAATEITPIEESP